MALGRILDALRESGFDDNTVVIYSSDHGSMLGAHGLTGKWLMYEESIRVPLIIRDPRLSAKLRGRRCDKMALSIDLAPTMLAMAGVPVPEEMQGRDLTPLLGGQPVKWRTDWYYEHTYDTKRPRRPIAKCEGVREEDWKYTRYPGTEPPYEQLDENGAYSWLKAPRWRGHAMEVGPLARMLVGYASGSDEFKEVVDGRAKRTPVEVHESYRELRRVSGEGLGEGAQVVLGGAHFLADGERVSVSGGTP